MLIRRLLLSILWCAFSWHHLISAQADDTHFSLHGAIGPSLTYLRHQHDHGDLGPSVTFHTAVYAHLPAKALSLGVLSLATISHGQQARARVHQSTVQGETDYQSVAFGPAILSDIDEHWQARLALLMGLQTIKYRQIRITGEDYQAHYKLAYQARGLELAGHYRTTLFGTPFALILSYKYLHGTKVSILGGNHKEVLTLYTEKSKSPLTEQTVALLADWKIF